MHRRASRASTSPQLSTLLGYQIDSDRLDRLWQRKFRRYSGLMTQQLLDVPRDQGGSQQMPSERQCTFFKFSPKSCAERFSTLDLQLYWSINIYIYTSIWDLSREGHEWWWMELISCNRPSSFPSPVNPTQTSIMFYIWLWLSQDLQQILESRVKILFTTVQLVSMWLHQARRTQWSCTMVYIFICLFLFSWAPDFIFSTRRLGSPFNSYAFP